MSLVIDSLDGLEINQPELHVAAIRSFQTITLLIKENPLNQEDIAIIRDFCDRLGFDLVYFPGIQSGDLFLEEINIKVEVWL